MEAISAATQHNKYPASKVLDLVFLLGMARRSERDSAELVYILSYIQTPSCPRFLLFMNY
jgi:hypothetical protein